MSKQFTLSRSEAARILGVSTRTIDRYVKGGKLSYKKVANNILIAEDEVKELQSDYQNIRKEQTSEIVRHVTPATQSNNTTEIESIIDKKMNTFLGTLNQKDQVIEDKNKLIFMLQQRIGELETKLQSMVSLPDFNAEKQGTMLEKQRLENKIFQMQGTLKREKNKSLLFLGIIVVLVLMYLILTKLNA